MTTPTQIARSYFGEFSRRVAGGVVVGRDGRVIVVNQHGNTWSLPKGHVEPGEDDLATASARLYEETGVSDLTFVKKLGEYERPSISKDGLSEEPDTKTRVIFLFRTEQMALEPIDPDNPEARWVERTRSRTC